METSNDNRAENQITHVFIVLCSCISRISKSLSWLIAISYMQLCELSFHKTRHLRNPFNENLPVKVLFCAFFFSLLKAELVLIIKSCFAILFVAAVVDLFFSFYFSSFSFELELRPGLSEAKLLRKVH